MEVIWTAHRCQMGVSVGSGCVVAVLQAEQQTEPWLPWRPCPSPSHRKCKEKWSMASLSDFTYTQGLQTQLCLQHTCYFTRLTAAFVADSKEPIIQIKLSSLYVNGILFQNILTILCLQRTAVWIQYQVKSFLNLLQNRFLLGWRLVHTIKII